MRFEFSFVVKYFLPKKSRFFSSFLSLLSILMVSLVFWLTTVFLSVMGGIEERWVQDISGVIPHIKLTPSKNYFNSYYYKIDEYASDSGYALKTIGEKLSSDCTDPYDISSDYPLPQDFPIPDKIDNGCLRDCVKELWHLLEGLAQQNGWMIREYEEGAACLKFQFSDSLEEVKCIDRISRVLSMQHPKTDSFFDTQSINNQDDLGGYPVILPDQFKKEGIAEGRMGFLEFYALGSDGFEERNLPIRVVGFYSAGVSPLAAKTVFVSTGILDSMRHTLSLPSSLNGIEIVLPKLSQISKSCDLISSLVDKNGLSDYWEIESLYQNPQFQPIFDQLHSDRILFLIVSIILILVACSNIIGMLVILVNDKKKEIGILRALGASPKNMSLIFGICGSIVGLCGSLFGGVLAFLTIKNLDFIISIFNFVQGRETFNKTLFGDFIPNQMNFSIFISLAIVTFVMAGLSGLIPAIKASRMNISEILRMD